jgi:hypothetical protein
MLSSMQMIDTNDLVSASFEACAEFGAGDGSPVCEACGWLEAEHDQPAASVRVLAARAVGALATPRRLAS